MIAALRSANVDLCAKQSTFKSDIASCDDISFLQTEPCRATAIMFVCNYSDSVCIQWAEFAYKLNSMKTMFSPSVFKGIVQHFGRYNGWQSMYDKEINHFPLCPFRLPSFESTLFHYVSSTAPWMALWFKSVQQFTNLSVQEHLWLQTLLALAEGANCNIVFNNILIETVILFLYITSFIFSCYFFVIDSVRDQSGFVFLI